MTLDEFARDIRFRYFRPHSGLKWYHRLNHRLAGLGVTLEVANTRLPADRRAARAGLQELVRTVPKMSTYANAALIDKAVADMPPRTAFVNVGVWHGFSFLAGIAANPDRECVAIDNFSQFGGPKAEFLARFEGLRSAEHHFHERDYEEYFSTTHRGQIGCYIYDGEHSYRNQLRGLEVAEPFFAEGCVILVDDTNLPDARQATLDFIARHPDRYRMLLDQATGTNGHPTFWNGLMVFRRVAA
jgi:hypothetical protein